MSTNQTGRGDQDNDWNITKKIELLTFYTDYYGGKMLILKELNVFHYCRSFIRC